MTESAKQVLDQAGWRSDMENRPVDKPLIGLRDPSATGRQPAFIGEVYDMRPSALIDVWSGKWADIVAWKPLDTPDQPDPLAAELRAALDEIERLREALAVYGTHADFDWPGDVPEFCGYECNVCDRGVDKDGNGHQSDCLLAGYPLPPRALTEEDRALAGGTDGN